MKKGNRILKTYAVILAAFSIYALLDTFVIPKAYTEAVSISGTESSARTADTGRNSKRKKSSDTGSAKTSSEITESSYSDGNISISLSEYRVYDTNVYVADVQLSSADFLKTAFANGTYGKNVTAKTSQTAAQTGAILAINGDYYGVREKGYVLRNGILYRNTPSKNQEDLVIYGDGSFEIICESEVSAEELLSEGAVQILSFGPALVENGQICVDENSEVGKAKASNPRTAIAVTDDLHYLFIVADGRTDESEGLSLYELAQFAQSLGAKTVYNLDGGGSSTMVFCGTVVNEPTSGGSIKERSVSDIVYIGY